MVDQLIGNGVVLEVRINDIRLIKIKMLLIKRFNKIKLKLKRFFYINKV